VSAVEMHFVFLLLVTAFSCHSTRWLPSSDLLKDLTDSYKYPVTTDQFMGMTTAPICGAALSALDHAATIELCLNTEASDILARKKI